MFKNQFMVMVAPLGKVTENHQIINKKMKSSGILAQNHSSGIILY